jgi:peptidoglycan/xylan/chitin deacetylase (PgdA/CDA1 family)
MKNVICLTYHDFFDKRIKNSDSGFLTNSSSLYKIDIQKFDHQLYLLDKHNLLIKNSIDLNADLENKVILTFDDGGSSAYHLCIKILEKYNTKGIFFITASYLNKEGFLTSKELIEISERGHIIGNHSFSHPRNIASLNFNQMKEEWVKCNDILYSVIKKKVNLASIPGGYYSKLVEESAIASGIEYLFTSEPVKKIKKNNDLLLIGRFPIMYKSHESFPLRLFISSYKRFIVYFLWEIKKILKKLPFDLYFKIRAIINIFRIK